ncbi:MAG: ABC transporter permease [Acidimicrobiales bacterium]
MYRLTLKNLAANRVRFALTTFAVVLAVSFVVSSFVLTDGLRSSFGDLTDSIVSGTDLEVRPVDDFGSAERLDPTMADRVAAVDGVAAVAPLLQAENTVLPMNDDGEQIPLNGPPQLALGWVDDAGLAGFTLVDGEAPDVPGEFTMDLDAAAANGFEVGGTYRLVTPTGPSEATLVGTTSFGEDNGTLGATLMHFELGSLQALMGIDGYDGITVALESGADAATATAAIAALDPDVEVVDQTTLQAEQEADFNQGIDIVGNVLLGFAGLSLFVSIFIIYNTFSIVLGQRTREMGLLRTVGADPAQLRRSVLGEATLIGVLASAIGIAAGVGVALGLRALFGAIGAQLPDSATIVSARTVLIALAVGIGVTLVSAVGPARKAARVPAMAALRDGAAAGEVSGRTRTLIGGALVAAGSAAGLGGLFVAGSTTSIIVLLAVGAMAFFIGVTLLSPLVVTPLTRAFGWPLARTFGVSGRLAHQNAGRNPHRTSTTAAALMIGLALVSMALTVGESVKAQLRETLAGSVTADYLISDDNTGGPLPVAMVSALGALPETGTMAGFRYDEARIDGEILDVAGTDLTAASTLIDFDVVDGAAVDASVADPVLVSVDWADEAGLAVGDTVPAEFASGATRGLTVVGIYAEETIMGEPFVLDRSTWDAVGAAEGDQWVALDLADGVSAERGDEALAVVEADYPQIPIATATAYVERMEGYVDQALTALNVMVALAVVIALIGIANTLALSVHERTRELGLLRAVGMQRRQLRRMVRFEAALVALFGAALGVAVGLLFGWGAVAALPAEVTSTLAVPIGRIALLVAVAAAAGLVAAWAPARRAGRLDVLEAIAA